MHLLSFSNVDTTMRLAEEFLPKKAYTRALADLPDSLGAPLESYGAALAF